MIDRHIYKAKRTDDGKWIIGNLVLSDLYGIMIPSSDRENWYLVDRTTVCQYTGLLDKKIQKLFEGDIVKEGDDIGIVKFGKYGNGFHYGFYIEWITCPHLRPELAFWNSRVERIGNVFDDQELLKGGKE